MKDDQEPRTKPVANPVFRYSDEQRAIPDATRWIWTRDARPVALQKVEWNNHGGSQMRTICFASLSEGLLDVRWPGGRQVRGVLPRRARWLRDDLNRINSCVFARAM